MLLSVAVRLAITKGFHRKEDIPTEAGATKQSVFWIAYIIDKGMCIRFGQAPMIDDDEIGIDLPPSDTSDAETSFLRCSVELALIQSKVCKWLYSPRFRTKPAGQRLQLMNELNNLLDTWHKGIPLRFTPEYHQSHHNAQIKIDPALNMHMNYYYAIICLHRTSLGISLEPDLEEAQRQESLTNVGMSAKLCLQASRATINLLNYGDGTLLTHYITFWCVPTNPIPFSGTLILGCTHQIQVNILPCARCRPCHICPHT